MLIPGALGLVSDLLGHRNIKTTANFYAGMRTREAAREFDRILERHRTAGASRANAMPKALRLALNDWPQIDRSIWERATAPIDYFDDLAPAARWSAKTRYQAQAAYGRWLAFLRDRFPEALQLPLAERVDRERAGALRRDARHAHYVDEHRRRARPPDHDVERPGAARRLGWLRQWQYRYQKRAVARDKRDKIVHPARLLELGLALMDSADTLSRPDERARQYRDGLLIALLAARPLRRRSLSELQIGTHLRRVGNRYVLALPGVNTKSGQPIEFPLPELLTPYMTRYLEHYRLLFPKAGNEQALWLSAKGGALAC